jgi:hypothetical protein
MQRIMYRQLAEVNSVQQKPQGQYAWIWHKMDKILSWHGSFAYIDADGQTRVPCFCHRDLSHALRVARSRTVTTLYIHVGELQLTDMVDSIPAPAWVTTKTFYDPSFRAWWNTFTEECPVRKELTHLPPVQSG